MLEISILYIAFVWWAYKSSLSTTVEKQKDKPTPGVKLTCTKE